MENGKKIKELSEEKDHWLNKVCDMENERFREKLVMYSTLIFGLVLRYLTL